MAVWDIEEQKARRERFFARVRGETPKLFSGDGSARMRQFAAPWREPLWILPALYTGAAEHVALANEVVARYNSAPPVRVNHPAEPASGKEFNIFNSNMMAHCLHRFGGSLTPEAREVMEWHTRQVFKTFRGAAQSDFKFHGANDNMPTLATYGLLMGGEALGDEAAVRHGTWNLHQLRRLLSRAAWASEFNSPTYSPITISHIAGMATFHGDERVRELALKIEERLWAELLLHYHPGTLHQAGPHSRAYAIDSAGHNHTLQALFWLAFGEEATGRDILKSYLEPDGVEVLHFGGNPYQSLAEYCDALDTDFHVPPHLAELVTRREYPAVVRGRAEFMSSRDGAAAECHTMTYMERDFSLGTASVPFFGGEQTNSLYITYRRSAEVRSFRDAASVFCKYLVGGDEIGAEEPSADGGWRSERFLASKGWFRALQKANTALLLSTPNLGKDVTTGSLRLCVIFPAHYGSIRRSVIGDGPVLDGAVGESADVVPVSVETGEVYIHVQPLLPTSMPRRFAVGFARSRRYEVLSLVNYDGPEREFGRAQLAAVLNGMVLTVASRRGEGAAGLKAFHDAMSDALVTDYYSAGHRYFLYRRADVEFEVVMTTDPFGVQTESIDGRHAPRPVMESNQIDVSGLPFMTGEVERNAPFFPWPDLEMHPYSNPWLTGSRGLAGERSYSRRQADLKWRAPS